MYTKLSVNELNLIAGICWDSFDNEVISLSFGKEIPSISARGEFGERLQELHAECKKFSVKLIVPFVKEVKYEIFILHFRSILRKLKLDYVNYDAKIEILLGEGFIKLLNGPLTGHVIYNHCYDSVRNGTVPPISAADYDSQK